MSTAKACTVRLAYILLIIPLIVAVVCVFFGLSISWFMVTGVLCCIIVLPWMAVMAARGGGTVSREILLIPFLPCGICAQCIDDDD